MPARPGYRVTSPSLDDDARSRGRMNAIEARRQRARIKDELAAGTRAIASVLDQRQDPILSRLRIDEVLRALPGIGPAKTARILKVCDIDPKRRLGQLGDLQARRVIDALSDQPSGGPTTGERGVSRADARLLVLSGPSGVGKSSVVSYLREHHPRLWFSVSVTTRAPRPGEIDGVDYHFITPEEFDRLRDSGELLEWAVFAGNSYGTPAAPVADRLARGEPVICEIELHGARQVRAADPQALLVFLAPPSWQVLVERLTGRGTEAPHVVAERLKTAQRELAAEAEFDVVVVNDSVPRAAEEIIGLLPG